MSESRIATPAVVAQRLAELLQCFPAAAIGGVQWHTLLRKYEEKHGEPVDLEVLGHSSALAGATALLWDVIRIVDASDTDNPVVAVEDAVAMTPTPGALASWPSLYHTLCEIALNQGTLEQRCDEVHGTFSHVILLSQVKPLLQRYWHCSFDELGLTYFTEEGSTIRLKKMKHLLQALLRWRALRVGWQNATDAARPSRSELDVAVAMELTLVPSKTHNDLLLRCESQQACPELAATSLPSPIASRPKLKVELPAHVMEASPAPSAATESTDDPLTPGGLSCTSAASERLEQELAFLRSENAKLRCQNNMLEGKVIFTDTVCPPQNEQADRFHCFGQPQFGLDDPFEPPPEIRHWVSSTAGSTPGSFSFASGTLTPFSESSTTSCAASGYVTPVPAQAGQMCNGVTYVPVAMPVWFQTIPNGVVQQARAMFENHAVIPSWFAQRS